MLFRSMLIGGAFGFLFKLFEDVDQSSSLSWLVTVIERKKIFFSHYLVSFNFT
jgi:hypothetical protein